MSQKIFSKTRKKIINLILYSKQPNQNMKALSGQLEYKNPKKQKNLLLNDFTFKIEYTGREPLKALKSRCLSTCKASCVL